MIANRDILVGAGSTLLSTVWIWPLPYAGLPPFASHMTTHIVVVAVAAPSFALAISGTRLDPVRLAPTRLAPIPLSILEFLGVWFWHMPAPHRFARESSIGMFLEQATFAISGFLLWIAAIGGGQSLRRLRVIESVAALLLTSMHMTLLGALITLASRALYEHVHAYGASVSFVALGPELDQQLGGAIMLLIGGASYLVGALWLLTESLRAGAPESRRS